MGRSNQMAETHVTEINDVSVIAVLLDPEDTRVCDYCNDVLIVWGGGEQQLNSEAKKGKNALIVRKRCHSTLYGLVCDKCKGDMQALRTYEAGDIVRADEMSNIEKITV